MKLLICAILLSLSACGFTEPVNPEFIAGSLNACDKNDGLKSIQYEEVFGTIISAQIQCNDGAIFKPRVKFS